MGKEGAHMRDTIDMAREVYGAHTEWSGAPLDRLEQLVALVRADERNRLAKECALLPFGDTAASFAVWIRNGGKP
jgi:hypothetical protein